MPVGCFFGRTKTFEVEKVVNRLLKVCTVLSGDVGSVAAAGEIILTEGHRYMPILLARRGERAALGLLSAAARQGLVPLLVIPPPPMDGGRRPGSHLIDVAMELGHGWNGRMFVDLGYFQEGIPDYAVHPLASFTDDLAQFGIAAVPVTSPTRAVVYNAAVAALHRVRACGVCLRLGPFDWPMGHRSHRSAAVEELLRFLGVSPAETDLVLDLGVAIRDGPSEALQASGIALAHLSYAREWRSIAVAGTAVPRDMEGIYPGLSPIRRAEWTNFRALAESSSGRRPVFGDYAIVSPDTYDRRFDSRPSVSAALRYASANDWIMAKGGQYLRKNGLKSAAMNLVADLLCESEYFAGRQHCGADEWITDVASGASGGNPEMWLRYGTIHHLTVASEQLAGIFGP
ncbi:Beta protein [Frankia sp. AiPs1]|uniref:beta family protein n=1 Tax=Frankia sp. AiPa1 TaxID=573492 RepID=UPI00202AEF8A|nr:beta family protein [Frankia sp. AiPa1]MCL9759678.1 beta family protein [Frankia sp. AiPa1]